MTKVYLPIPGYKLPVGIYTPVSSDAKHVLLRRPDGKVVSVFKSRVVPAFTLLKGGKL